MLLAPIVVSATTYLGTATRNTGIPVVVVVVVVVVGAGVVVVVVVAVLPQLSKQSCKVGYHRPSLPISDVQSAWLLDRHDSKPGQQQQ